MPAMLQSDRVLQCGFCEIPHEVIEKSLDELMTRGNHDEVRKLSVILGLILR
jgi:hypothetical protein